MKDSTDFLSRCLEPLGQCLTLNSARRIVRLRADPTVESRVSELADKSSAGTLTPEERAEYELFVKLATSVALVQAKAQAYLDRNAKSRTRTRRRSKALVG